jgi:hypothetical protein
MFTNISYGYLLSIAAGAIAWSASSRQKKEKNTAVQLIFQTIGCSACCRMDSPARPGNAVANSQTTAVM